MGALMVLIDAAGAVETWAWRRGHARTERVMRAVWLRLLCEAAARSGERPVEGDGEGPW